MVSFQPFHSVSYPADCCISHFQDLFLTSSLKLCCCRLKCYTADSLSFLIIDWSFCQSCLFIICQCLLILQFFCVVSRQQCSKAALHISFPTLTVAFYFLFLTYACTVFMSNLPPTKVHAIARDVCLSVSKITQKRVYGFRWNVACQQMSEHGRTNWSTFEPDPDHSPDAGTRLLSPLSY